MVRGGDKIYRALTQGEMDTRRASPSLSRFGMPGNTQFIDIGAPPIHIREYMLAY